MNVIKQLDQDLGQDLGLSRIQMPISSNPEMLLEHPSAKSEAGQKPRNDAVDINLSTWLVQLRFLIKDSQLLGDSSVMVLKRLASALNAEMSPMTKWGWRYIHQVSYRDMPPSKKLQIAISRLYRKRTLKEALPLEQIIVLAPLGYVQNNSILRIRSKECASTTCSMSFVPSRSNHIYCCPACGRQNRREIRRSNFLIFKKELGF